MTCKVFISQLMKDKTNEEIKQERVRIEKYIKSYVKNKFHIDDDIKFLDSFIPDLEIPEECKRDVYFMSKSLEILSQADLAVFGAGWEKGRGTVIEHDVCSKYNIKYLDLEKGDI